MMGQAAMQHQMMQDPNMIDMNGQQMMSHEEQQQYMNAQQQMMMQPGQYTQEQLEVSRLCRDQKRKPLFF